MYLKVGIAKLSISSERSFSLEMVLNSGTARFYCLRSIQVPLHYFLEKSLKPCGKIKMCENRPLW